MVRVAVVLLAGCWVAGLVAQTALPQATDFSARGLMALDANLPDEAAQLFKIKLSTPFEKFPKKTQKLLIEGGNGFAGILSIP